MCIRDSTYTSTYTHHITGEDIPSTSSYLCSHKAGHKPKECDSTSDKIVVIGALSFLGSRLIPRLMLDDSNDIIAVAQDGDIMAMDELLWYRKDQLLEHHRVLVNFANFSNSTQLQRTILGDDGKTVNPSTLLYVAPGFEEEEHRGEGVNINDAHSEYLKEFVQILEMLRQASPCTKVVLVTESPASAVTSHDSHVMLPNNHLTINQGWMRTFELTLSTYHNLYQIPITVFRASGVHGPWSHTALKLLNYTNKQRGGTLSMKEWSNLLPKLCWYVEDVMERLVKALAMQIAGCAVIDIGGCKLMQNSNLSRESLEQRLESAATALKHVHTQEVQQSWRILNGDTSLTLQKAVKKSLSWAKSYRSQRTVGKLKSLVFTSYFTSAEDSQRNLHIKPNKFEYLREWALSLKELKMEAVIFHDGMNAGFQHRLSQFYSNISFEYVTSLQYRSTNDARFYAYLRYLEHHPNIDRVLLTDISDVRFQFNPFELMSLLGNWLYIGTDIDIFPSMKTMQWIHERLRGCYGNYSVDHGDLNQLMELDTVYNAGTIGGSRDVVLAALSRIVEYLNLTPTQLNCNMPAVNYAVHKHFYDMVFTGYPLNSRFLRKQSSPKGVYIIHK